MRHVVLALVVPLVACAPTEGTLPLAVPDADDQVVEVPTDTPAADEPWLILTDVQLRDAGLDGRWSPGEDAVLHATLVNAGADDFMWYPGVRAETSDERVEIEYGGTWLYGIFGRTTMQLEMPVRFTGDVAPGDEVTFTLRVTSLSCEQPESSTECEIPDGDEVQLTVRVQ